MTQTLVILATLLGGLKLWFMARQLRLWPDHPRRERLQKLFKGELLAMLLVIISLLFAPQFIETGIYSEPIYWSVGPLLIFVMVYYKVILMPVLRQHKAKKVTRLDDFEGLPVLENGEETHSNARAFAGFGSAFIACSAGLRKNLNADEVKSVLAHELGHIRHKHHMKLVWVLVAFYCFYYGLYLFLTDHSDAGLVLVEIILGSWLVKGLMSPVICQLMKLFEFQADQEAATICGADVFAQSLKKIWAGNADEFEADPFFAFWFNAHPKPEERLERLAVQQDMVEQGP